MVLFLVGLLILVVGGFFYGKFCEKVFGPDDRKTPAYGKQDGVDYVPMKTWRNTFINLLNIAGTGPILGPIQGILFGPIAFITIPLGCVLAGSLHDYFNGMICTRNGGAQMPKVVTKYLGKSTKTLYLIFSSILLLLVGVVFTYTPGNLIVNDILGIKPDPSSWVLWLVYGLIFIYYILATVFPIDTIIGKIYPIFGAFLVVSAIGVLIGVLFTGGADLNGITGVLMQEGAEIPFVGGLVGHYQGIPFIPVFFITVACGIMSGFHGSQTSLISRTIENEKQGRMVFFNSMLMEGAIAMIWAAGAMVLFNRGTALNTNSTLMVGIISKGFMGNFGGLLAIIGVIVLPITSGDTAFRSLRLQIAETFHIDQKSSAKRMGLAAALFVPALAILIFAVTNANGFNILWRYFGWANQTLAIFALGMITVYIYTHKKGNYYLMSFIPALFYMFIISSFILHADIGFNLDKLFGLGTNDYTVSYIVGVVLTALYGYAIWVRMHTKKEDLTTFDV